MSTRDEQHKTILFHYPFLDRETVEACLEYIAVETTIVPRRLTPGLVYDALNAVATNEIATKYPTLEGWQLREICHKLIDLSKSLRVNCFKDGNKVERVYKEVARLPSSSEELNHILVGLTGESDVAVIKTRLLQIAVYIRTAKKSIRSQDTTEGDNMVANIEKSLLGFLNSIPKSVFRETYPLVRELVAITPKINVLGVDINELRDNVARYHENRSSDSCFVGVAEDIREAVHRRLSGAVIQTIDELVAFLDSDSGFAFISGRYCRATEEEKRQERGCAQFKDLILAREQLRLIWNDPFQLDSNTHTPRQPAKNTAFIRRAKALCQQLVSPLKDDTGVDDHVGFFAMMHRTIMALGEGRFDEMDLGPVRNALTTVIFDLAGKRHSNENLLLNLMTLDCVLENISIVYYSNIVNAELFTIEDDNLEKAVAVLVDLVYCARATGHGTRAMRSIATSLESNLKTGKIRKVEAQTCIGEIDRELMRFVYQLSQEIHNILFNCSYHGQAEDLNRLHAALLNDMTRAKTTHLLSNLLSSIGQFLGGTGSDETRKLSKIGGETEDRSFQHSIELDDMVFHFGLGILNLPNIGERDWFLGGKGASEVAMSRIVNDQKLVGVDVPKGFGLSTRTWQLVRGDRNRQQELRNIIANELKILEVGTKKQFGNPQNPLLLAARSGAIVSMPGVLPTVTHIGLNEEIVTEWAKTLTQPYRAYHAYIRFLFNYTEAVFFGTRIARNVLFEGTGAKRISQLLVEDLGVLEQTIQTVKKNIESSAGGFVVPSDVNDQLFDSVIAIFASYELDDVLLHHQELKSIPNEYQTSCLIQDCLPVLETEDCSGVFLTRNPLDGGVGKIEYIRDFGEDLAGGRVSPGSNEKFKTSYTLQDEKLREIGAILEKEYASPMDIEFSIRNGSVSILQFRPLKLAPMADVVNNYRFYTQGLMSDIELIERTRRIVGQPLMNTFLEEIVKHKNAPIAFGQPIAGGVVSGHIVYNVEKISDYPDEPIIFITKSNVPREVTTKSFIDGYVSEEGGVTSHASLISIGKIPCIVGVKWSQFESTILIGDDVEIEEGEIVTLDANDGCIYKGELPILSSPENNPQYLKAEQEILELVRGREEQVRDPHFMFGEDRTR